MVVGRERERASDLDLVSTAQILELSLVLPLVVVWLRPFYLPLLWWLSSFCGSEEAERNSMKINLIAVSVYNYNMILHARICQNFVRIPPKQKQSWELDDKQSNCWLMLLPSNCWLHNYSKLKLGGPTC